MRNRLVILGCAALAGLIAASCGPTTVSPTAGPTARPTPVPTPTTSPEEMQAKVWAARDAALAYVTREYGDQAPALDLTWSERLATPAGIVGATTYEYSAGDWLVTIVYPIVPPEETIYQVIMTNERSGFHWEGEVNARGKVRELISR